MENKVQRIDVQKSQDLLQNVTLSIQKATTIDHAINGTQLIKFERVIGRDKAVALICDMIIAQAGFFNLPNTVTVQQALEIAEMIIQENPYLTVEDIVIMFREAKMQKQGYEKPYGRLDGSLIFSWLNNYIERKLDRQDEIREREKKEHQNALHEAGANILEKLSPTITAMLNRNQDKPRPPVSGIMTQEKHLQFVRENISNMTIPELQTLVVKFRNQNMFGSYKDILIEISNEIKNREENSKVTKTTDRIHSNK